MTAPKMTEHRKLAQLQDRVECLQSFLSYLATLDWQICQVYQGEVTDRIEMNGTFVYRYFGLDPDALEAEREQAVRYVLEH